MPMSKPVNILGGILAGGLSRRMEGGEKCLLELDGLALIGHVGERLARQVPDMVINANSDPDRFLPFDNTVVPDIVQGHAGPLAGIHALLAHAIKADIRYTHVASVAGDTPFFPLTLVDKCKRQISDEIEFQTIVIARSGGFKHPVFGLWPVSLFEPLDQFLQRAQTRKVMAFVNEHPCKYVDFELNTDCEPADPFFNINSPLDMNEAHAIVSRNKPDPLQCPPQQ